MSWFAPTPAELVAHLPAKRARTYGEIPPDKMNAKRNRQKWQAKHGKEWYAKHADERRQYMKAYYQNNPHRRDYLLTKQRERRAKMKELLNGT